MAKNSGRRSSGDLGAAQFVLAIDPTRALSKSERDIWNRVMGAWPHDHWVASDSEILTQYCAVCLCFEDARKRKDLSAMEKAGRLVLSYATKLRITPHSRYDHKGAHVEAKRGRENEAAADRLLGGVDEWASPESVN